MALCPLTWIWITFIIAFVFVRLCHWDVIYNSLPTLIKDMVVYGKLLDKGKRSTFEQYLLVPKRLFVQFYILSFIWNGLILSLVLRCCLTGAPLPSWYVRILTSLTCYSVSPPSVNLLTILIALIVIVIHAARRVYECLMVSVYSKSSINLAHYITGMLFYSLSGISVMAEGPQLTQLGVPLGMSDFFGSLKWHHAAGLMMFLWASWHHHKAHVIFASLRTNPQDANKHLIPQGDWFSYVSCPHYLAECLIYTSLLVILGGRHTMWWFVLGFVVSNQTAAALRVHTWYVQKFEDYPKERKALIPFLV